MILRKTRHIDGSIAIISWLINIAKAIGYWFQEIFKEAIKFTMTTWGLVLIVAGLVWTAINDTVGAINTLVGTIDGMDTGSWSVTASGGSVGFILSVCNTFAPMDELFAYAAVYLLLMGAFGLYRLIKSWIPTLAGG